MGFFLNSLGNDIHQNSSSTQTMGNSTELVWLITLKLFLKTRLAVFQFRNFYFMDLLYDRRYILCPVLIYGVPPVSTCTCNIQKIKVARYLAMLRYIGN